MKSFQVHVVGGSSDPQTNSTAGRVSVKTAIVEKRPARPDHSPVLMRTAQQFEYDVRRVVKRHLAKDMKGIRVQGPVVKIGISGARHEFDLWYTFRLGHVEHHVVWEARCRSRPVSKEQVASFIGKISDLRERPTGAIVSSSGFQIGAKKLAFANGIRLYKFDGFQSRRPVIALENPAVTVHAQNFHVICTSSLSMAFADLTEQVLASQPPAGRTSMQ